MKELKFEISDPQDRVDIFFKICELKDLNPEVETKKIRKGPVAVIGFSEESILKFLVINKIKFEFNPLTDKISSVTCWVGEIKTQEDTDLDVVVPVNETPHSGSVHTPDIGRQNEADRNAEEVILDDRGRIPEDDSDDLPSDDLPDVNVQENPSLLDDDDDDLPM